MAKDRMCKRCGENLKGQFHPYTQFKSQMCDLCYWTNRLSHLSPIPELMKRKADLRFLIKETIDQELSKKGTLEAAQREYSISVSNRKWWELFRSIDGNSVDRAQRELWIAKSKRESLEREFDCIEGKAKHYHYACERLERAKANTL